LSIALTVAAYKWFVPQFEASGRASDLLAMLNWVDAVLAQFVLVETDEGSHSRLSVELPVTPWSDVMKWMSKAQMICFKEKMEALRDALSDAYDEDLPEDACNLLNKQFGDDFKIPAKPDT